MLVRPKPNKTVNNINVAEILAGLGDKADKFNDRDAMGRLMGTTSNPAPGEKPMKKTAEKAAVPAEEIIISEKMEIDGTLLKSTLPKLKDAKHKLYQVNKTIKSILGIKAKPKNPGISDAEYNSRIKSNARNQSNRHQGVIDNIVKHFGTDDYNPDVDPMLGRQSKPKSRPSEPPKKALRKKSNPKKQRSPKTMKTSARKNRASDDEIMRMVAALKNK